MKRFVLTATFYIDAESDTEAEGIWDAVLRHAVRVVEGRRRLMYASSTLREVDAEEDG